MATTTRASINGSFYDFATIFTFTVWYSIVNTKISILLYSLSHQKEILDEKRKRDELRKKKNREGAKKRYYKQKEEGTLRTYQDRRDYLRAYNKEYYYRKRKQSNGELQLLPKDNNHRANMVVKSK